MRCFLVVIAGMVAIAQTPPSNPPESACMAQRSVWKQGIEFRHTLCPPGVDVEVSPSPIPGFAGAPSPIAYIVSIRNYSATRVESDPAQWRLLWTEKKGTSHEDSSLTARQVGISRIGQTFGRSTLFADQSATGFVYFKKPKAKDALLAITFEPDNGSPVEARIPVSAIPVPLLP